MLGRDILMNIVSSKSNKNISMPNIIKPVDAFTIYSYVHVSILLSLNILIWYSMVYVSNEYPNRDL
jgi:hypothetical protein